MSGHSRKGNEDADRKVKETEWVESRMSQSEFEIATLAGINQAFPPNGNTSGKTIRQSKA